MSENIHKTFSSNNLYNSQRITPTAPPLTETESETDARSKVADSRYVSQYQGVDNSNHDANLRDRNIASAQGARPKTTSSDQPAVANDSSSSSSEFNSSDYCSDYNYNKDKYTPRHTLKYEYVGGVRNEWGIYSGTGTAIPGRNLYDDSNYKAVKAKSKRERRKRYEQKKLEAQKKKHAAATAMKSQTGNNTADCKLAVTSESPAAKTAEPKTNIYEPAKIDGKSFTVADFLSYDFTAEEVMSLNGILIKGAIDLTIPDNLNKITSILKIKRNMIFQFDAVVCDRASFKCLVDTCGKFPSARYIVINNTNKEVENIDGFVVVDKEDTEDFDESRFLTALTYPVNTVHIKGDVNISIPKGFDDVFTKRDIKNLIFDGNASIYISCRSLKSRVNSMASSGIINVESCIFPNFFRDNILDGFAESTLVGYLWTGVNTAKELQEFEKLSARDLYRELDPAEVKIESIETIARQCKSTIHKSLYHSNPEALVVTTKLILNAIQGLSLDMLNTMHRSKEEFIKRYGCSEGFGDIQLDIKWKLPKTIDTSNNFSAKDIKKVCPTGAFSDSKDNLKFYYSKMHKFFNPLIDQVLFTARKLHIKPDSKIFTTMSAIQQGFQQKKPEDFFVLLANPEVFAQTDKPWSY